MDMNHYITNHICVITLDKSLISDSVDTLYDDIQALIEESEIKGVVIVFELHGQNKLDFILPEVKIPLNTPY